MIIQGTNIPILIEFYDDLSDVAELLVTLWRRNGTELKRWTTEDMIIEGDTATLPITEEESAALPEGYNTMEIKGLDDNGNTIFWESAQVLIEGRRDKLIQLTGE